MAAEFDINQANPPFEAKQPPFILQVLNETAKDIVFNVTDLIDNDIADGVSLLGTKVFSNLEFQPGEFTDEDGEQVAFEGLRIDTVLMTVVQQKNIVVTPVAGRNGTVKEYVSDNDYLATCTGLIIGETAQGAPQKEVGVGVTSTPILTKFPIGNTYPDRDVARFIKLCQVPEALSIESSFLERFGSFNWVVESYDLGQVPGLKNAQQFRLSLLSDTPIELQPLI